MIDNYLDRDALVRGSDLDELFNTVNNNELEGDGITTSVSKNVGSTTISIIEQPSAGGAGATAASSVHPFVMSIDSDTLTIGTGKVAIKNYTGVTQRKDIIPTEEIDLSAYLEGVHYFYLKLPTDWTHASGDLRNTPDTTIGATNFASNQTVYPETDFTHFFEAIGRVNISIDEGVRSYTLVQTQFTDSEIFGLQLHNFQTVAWWEGKTNDTDADTNKIVYVNEGFAYLSDNTVGISTFNVTLPLFNQKYFYLLITATENVDEWFEGYSATLENATSLPSTLDESYPWQISKYSNGSISQSEVSDYRSNARTY